MLLELLLSSCHECGHQEDYTQRLEATHYKESMYILSFKCPLCGEVNQVLASEDDIKRLFNK
jgi:uncharacterized Zn finger protein